MKTDILDLIVISIPGNASILHALKMSNWLKEQGLDWGKDYDWHIDRIRNETKFRFHNAATLYSTLFSLRWLNHEV